MDILRWIAVAELPGQAVPQLLGNRVGFPHNCLSLVLLSRSYRSIVVPSCSVRTQRFQPRILACQAIRVRASLLLHKRSIQKGFLPWSQRETADQLWVYYLSVSRLVKAYQQEKT